MMTMMTTMMMIMMLMIIIIIILNNDFVAGLASAFYTHDDTLLRGKNEENN